MNKRDNQIAALILQVAQLDKERLAVSYEQIRQAYDAASIVERVTIIEEISDRTPSDFRVLTSGELRRIEHFNGPNYSWEMYCKELGRSVAIGEENYLFQVVQEQIPDVPVSAGVRFHGLHDVIGALADEGHSPDFVLAPISYMVGFLSDQGHSMEWDNAGGEYLLSRGRRLQLLWSSRGRPLDRFIVFDHEAGIWHVKLDPHQGGGRLTVAIGEQPSPHGVVFLAETVAKYEITDRNAFRSFRPDLAVDPNFDSVR